MDTGFSKKLTIAPLPVLFKPFLKAVCARQNKWGLVPLSSTVQIILPGKKTPLDRLFETIPQLIHESANIQFKGSTKRNLDPLP